MIQQAPLDGPPDSVHIPVVEFEELYHEILMDHAKHPRNQRKLADPDAEAHADNPLCGDTIDLYLKVDADGAIQEITFEARACSICTASASLMTRKIGKLEMGEALQLVDHFIRSLSGGDSALPLAEVGDLAALEGVKKFPMRIKCATLPWHAFKEAAASLGRVVK